MAGPKPQSGGGRGASSPRGRSDSGVSSDSERSERSLADLSEFDESEFDGDRTEYTDISLASLSATGKARKKTKKKKKKRRAEEIPEASPRSERVFDEQEVRPPPDAPPTRSLVPLPWRCQRRSQRNTRTL